MKSHAKNQFGRISSAAIFKFATLLLSTSLALGCSIMSRTLPEQKTVSHVELSRFMGKWFVIASIPTVFEKGAVNATETYTWNEHNQRIDIDFRYRKDRPDGAEKTIPQKGFIYDSKTNAEWRIQPFWPLKFAYLIIDLADDYSDTTIGVPNRGHVWIMARSPAISDDRYNHILKKIKSLGYDMDALKKVPQIWTDK